MKVTAKKIILGLSFLAILIGATTIFLNQPPKVVNYSPKEENYFSTIKVSFSKKVIREKIRLVIEPFLKTQLNTLNEKTFTWQVRQLPRLKTIYTFKIYYKNKLLKEWQVNTPANEIGVGSYSPQFEEALKTKLQRKYLLQHLPKPNSYYGVRYYNEKYIAIYIYRQPDKAKLLVKKWLATLPPSIRAELKVDWVE